MASTVPCPPSCPATIRSNDASSNPPSSSSAFGGTLRYALSYRDLEDMMRERGLCVDHTTIYRWVQRYAPEIDKRCRPFLRRTNDSYRIDETYVRVAGAWTYLYRGVDSNGDTLDFLLRATRDRKAAIAFFRKTLGAAHTTPPRVVTVDKNPAYPVAFEAVPTRGTRPTAFESSPMQVSEQHHRAGPPIHQTPHPADAGLQAIHHGVADLARHRDHACAPQGTGAMDGEGRRGRADAAESTRCSDWPRNEVHPTDSRA